MQRAGELQGRFVGRAVAYPLAELDALQPAYAVTIRKSQGSEYPAEFFDYAKKPRSTDLDEALVALPRAPAA